MNFPAEFCERMKAMLNSEYDDFLSSFSSESESNAIRLNCDKELIDKEFGRLDHVPWCEKGFYIDKSKISGNHPYHLAGLFYFQEASAMCAGEALPIEEGDFVLDLCAAPGGKSTHIAARLNGSGLLVSNEINKKRAQILSENIERMGFSNVIVSNESPEKLESCFPAFFDKIIVDAPCSGEGMFRKEPKAITEWSKEHTISCAERQRHILKSAIKMLKPGGFIVYSTCTFAPCENEETISFILESFPSFKLCEMPKLSMLIDGTIPLTKRIYPHKMRGEGHFAALLKNTSEPEPKKPQNTKSNITKENLKLVQDFFNTFMNIKIPDGTLITYGDNIYSLPYGVNIDKLRVLRPGLHLGICKKGRFEPSHALALALNSEDFKNTLDFSPDSDELLKYLHGNTIPCDKKGWVCVTVSNNPIGLGKASNGILKNHYPKHLRLL